MSPVRVDSPRRSSEPTLTSRSHPLVRRRYSDAASSQEDENRLHSSAITGEGTTLIDGSQGFTSFSALTSPNTTSSLTWTEDINGLSDDAYRALGMSVSSFGGHNRQLTTSALPRQIESSIGTRGEDQAIGVVAQTTEVIVGNQFSNALSPSLSNSPQQQHSLHVSSPPSLSSLETASSSRRSRINFDNIEPNSFHWSQQQPDISTDMRTGRIGSGVDLIQTQVTSIDQQLPTLPISTSLSTPTVSSLPPFNRRASIPSGNAQIEGAVGQESTGRGGRERSASLNRYTRTRLDSEMTRTLSDFGQNNHDITPDNCPMTTYQASPSIYLTHQTTEEIHGSLGVGQCSVAEQESTLDVALCDTEEVLQYAYRATATPAVLSQPLQQITSPIETIVMDSQLEGGAEEENCNEDDDKHILLIVSPYETHGSKIPEHKDNKAGQAQRIGFTAMAINELGIDGSAYGSTAEYNYACGNSIPNQVCDIITDNVVFASLVKMCNTENDSITYLAQDMQGHRKKSNRAYEQRGQLGELRGGMICVCHNDIVIDNKVINGDINLKASGMNTINNNISTDNKGVTPVNYSLPQQGFRGDIENMGCDTYDNQIRDGINSPYAQSRISITFSAINLSQQIHDVFCPIATVSTMALALPPVETIASRETEISTLPMAFRHCASKCSSLGIITFGAILTQPRWHIKSRMDSNICDFHFLLHLHPNLQQYPYSSTKLLTVGPISTISLTGRLTIYISNSYIVTLPRLSPQKRQPHNISDIFSFFSRYRYLDTPETRVSVRLLPDTRPPILSIHIFLQSRHRYIKLRKQQQYNFLKMTAPTSNNERAGTKNGHQPTSPNDQQKTNVDSEFESDQSDQTHSEGLLEAHPELDDFVSDFYD
ncbi:hypothetical protein BGZ49_000718, partial [Haplosporangium sp. Z 27]